MTDYQKDATLSIDSATVKEDRVIKLEAKLSRMEISNFLEEMKAILNSEDFDVSTNFFMILKSKPGDDLQYSTSYTLQDLQYNSEDVISTLKELTIKEFSTALIDRDNTIPPILFVFGKSINNKTVYIKLKIKENQKKYILCVSFHYAKEKMSFPFAQ